MSQLEVDTWKTLTALMAVEGFSAFSSHLYSWHFVIHRQCMKEGLLPYNPLGPGTSRFCSLCLRSQGPSVEDAKMQLLPQRVMRGLMTAEQLL